MTQMESIKDTLGHIASRLDTLTQHQAILPPPPPPPPSSCITNTPTSTSLQPPPPQPPTELPDDTLSIHDSLHDSFVSSSRTSSPTRPLHHLPTFPPQCRPYHPAPPTYTHTAQPPPAFNPHPHSSYQVPGPSSSQYQYHTSPLQPAMPSPTLKSPERVMSTVAGRDIKALRQLAVRLARQCYFWGQCNGTVFT